MVEIAELASTVEPDINREIRLYDDTTTWLAEVLDGQMRTSFEYAFDGKELYGRDGSLLKPIFKTAIKDAEQKVKYEPQLAFEVRRRYVEDEELEDMYAMSRGELPNTMVVISDFPPELAGAIEDIGGYNVKRKQTMLRVITKSEDGKLGMRSQSLDMSDRRSLEALYQYLGFEAQPGELLGQRMHIELPSEEQEFLIDWLTGVYDRSLSSIYGGEWCAGRTPAEILNTYDFVRSQRDLIDTFVRHKLSAPEYAEDLRYGVAAAMEKRFKARLQFNVVESIARGSGHNFGNTFVLQEIHDADNWARAQGKTYSGCGLSMTADSQASAVDEMSELGYGNKSGEDKYGSLTFKCQKGHTNTRPHNQLIPNCKICGISVKC